MSTQKKADMIVDLQYGSTGKGLIAGYLAKKNAYDTVINANMPNAGHTFIDGTGRKWVHKVLPNGIVSPVLRKVMIGPGSVFSVSRLKQEIEESMDLLHSVDIMIHPAACVLSEENVAEERMMHNNISSTMQGSASAMVQKIRRDPDNSPLAEHHVRELSYLGSLAKVVSLRGWNNALMRSHQILIEGAQGYSLGINAGFWPYCTSRDCTPARFMADAGVPLTYLDRVIGTARTLPIRVGNTENGFSGPHYVDQREMSWDEVGVTPEMTTVTRRQRRIFSFSVSQIEEAIFACKPDEIFLNFCNYLTESQVEDIVSDINMAVDTDGHANSMGVVYTGWGPTEDDIVEITHERSSIIPTRKI